MCGQTRSRWRRRACFRHERGSRSSDETAWARGAQYQKSAEPPDRLSPRIGGHIGGHVGPRAQSSRATALVEQRQLRPPFGRWCLHALQQPGVNLVQMMRSQRQMPVVVSEPGFDARDGPREPLTVGEWDEAVVPAVKQQDRNAD